MINTPRIEINLRKIHHNASVLVTRMKKHGISVTGITKTTLGNPQVAAMMVQAGVVALGDSRVENIQRMTAYGVEIPTTLIRSPMLSHVDRVVRHVDISFNTELKVIRMLAKAAKKANRRHEIILMVELGDLREGVMLADVKDTVGEILKLPNIYFKGLGTNLACQNGVIPDANNMGKLTDLTNSIESTFGIHVDIISGGNSANLAWAFSTVDTGRINNLRFGESILLGREPLHRKPIKGLYTDAFTVVAEVIESKTKPAQPWGKQAQTAFGRKPQTNKTGEVLHSILAIGQQDIDPSGLTPPVGIEIMGASGDHLVVNSTNGKNLEIGDELSFQPDYSALLRAMTSDSIIKKTIVDPRN